MRLHAEKIQEQLQSMGDPPTKMYPGQLILFPTVYRMEVRFDDGLKLPPIAWDSDLPRHESQYRKLEYQFTDGASVLVQYQLHVYKKRQRIEQDANFRLRWVSLLAVAGTVLAFSWVYLVQRRESERERQRVESQHQIDQAERLRIEEELRRQEAERLHEETERNLLEQRLATQAAERQALELKSQLYASIGIMAGSYAHNIKNLLVRPNDLLRRCLEADGLSGDQEQMLHEVRQTLGTVTERLQQILRTVRRDPNHAELSRIDLNAVLRDLGHTWGDLARESWKLEIGLDLDAGAAVDRGRPVALAAGGREPAVQRPRRHLRDAQPPPRRGAAAGFRRHGAGRRARAAGADRGGGVEGRASCCGRGGPATGRVLEVRDNGIGMTEEVRRRCTETHFSTKRDNAIYEGHSTGMGLGLSFVTSILEHHGAPLEIESEPLRGATFRAAFRLAEAAPQVLRAISGAGMPENRK